MTKIIQLTKTSDLSYNGTIIQSGREETNMKLA